MHNREVLSVYCIYKITERISSACDISCLHQKMSNESDFSSYRFSRTSINMKLCRFFTDCWSYMAYHTDLIRTYRFYTKHHLIRRFYWNKEKHSRLWCSVISFATIDLYLQERSIHECQWRTQENRIKHLQNLYAHLPTHSLLDATVFSFYRHRLVQIQCVYGNRTPGILRIYVERRLRNNENPNTMLRGTTLHAWARSLVPRWLPPPHGKVN
jgi:hypothetical protein